MKVLLITGGTSSERKISLMSAKQVKIALQSIGHIVKTYDFNKGYGELKKISKTFDVVFPVIHGEEGEGGNLQKFLSQRNIRFVGGNWQGYKRGWYKIPFKKFCDQNKILTAQWKIITPNHVFDAGSKKVIPKQIRNDKIKQIITFGFPSVLKSSSGGSSREVVILKSEQNLKSYPAVKLLRSDLPLFVERYLDGVEVTVGILEDKALPVIEIRPPKDGWFDYKNKYWGNTKEIADAPSLSPKLKRLTQNIAEKIHKTLNLGTYSRIDFIVASHIGSGNTVPYALEVNTIPGLTASSLFPKAAAAIGITFPKLMDSLVKSAKISYKPLA